MGLTKPPRITCSQRNYILNTLWGFQCLMQEIGPVMKWGGCWWMTVFDRDMTHVFHSIAVVKPRAKAVFICMDRQQIKTIKVCMWLRGPNRKPFFWKPSIAQTKCVTVGIHCHWEARNPLCCTVNILKPQPKPTEEMPFISSSKSQLHLMLFPLLLAGAYISSILMAHGGRHRGT